jgi:hypothetical protein
MGGSANLNPLAVVVLNASGQEPIMDGSVYRNVALTSPAVIQTPAVAVANAALTVTPVVMARVVVLDRQDVAAANVTIRMFKNVVMIKTLIIPAILIKFAVKVLVVTLIPSSVAMVRAALKVNAV